MKNKKNLAFLPLFALNLLILLIAVSAQNENVPPLSPHEQSILARADSENNKIYESPNKFNLNWLYVSAPVLLIAIFLSYIEIKRVKDHKGLMFNRRQHKNLALRNYAVTNLKKGFSKDQIKNTLAKNNYNHQEIEEAFKDIK